MALLFLLPALVLLGALVVYPIVFSVGRSFYDATGSRFVGVENYGEIFSAESTLTAIKNNLIWVVVAPTVVTALGLIFAVLTERIRWSTAFKVLIFMPMAISFLSAGVTWRLIYEQDPETGVANAAVGAVVDVVRPPGSLPGARPSDEEAVEQTASGLETTATVTPGDTVAIGLVAIPPEQIPSGATAAAEPAAVENGVGGTVWLDFTPGGGGEPGQVDAEERGLPGVSVEAVDADGTVVANATTDPDGTFTLPDVSGDVSVRLGASNFREPFSGISWLGPALVTPAIIVSYVWIWAGFAMVVIAAGLAAIPRELLEAARVDGASEWQVFRRVTVPLLAPVLGVVFVTLVINVLKIFDLVLVIAPGSAQREANVIALQMWKTAFGARNFGLGSALAVFLLVLVIPAMLFNIRRFRAEET
ncbi:MAG TPA: ABC transporter permease subunit [Actinomycetota bacterium]|nr:ABC transporter permease subunit [Actinomycetota bacterium]